jgi:hypothetical protein
MPGRETGGGERRAYTYRAFGRSERKGGRSICELIFDQLSAAIGEPIVLRSLRVRVIGIIPLAAQ